VGIQLDEELWSSDSSLALPIRAPAVEIY
jgi:hypothetical protein